MTKGNGNPIFTMLPTFFHSQLFVTPSYPTTDCTGKTIVVTGSNTGLGKEASRHFVRLNAAKVIIACRSLDKGEAAKAEIESSERRQGVVEVWKLDLQDYGSVKAFAERVKGLERIDAVVENAGINTNEYNIVGGNEGTITVNVVSTFLLALLLLPKLQDVAEKYGFAPTLTIVASEVHFVTPFNERKSDTIFETLNNKERADMGDRYHVSKMLEVLTCREIAKQNPQNELKVTLNFVNPGWCHSELIKDPNLLVRLAMKMFCRTTEVGSRTLVHAGLSGPETHGKYLSDCHIAQCSPLVEGPDGPEIQSRVWQELSGKLEDIEPGVSKVLAR